MSSDVTPRYDVRRPSPLHVAVTAGAISIGLGYVLTQWAMRSASMRMLPWILGRGLGVAGYLALTGLTALGLWLRHPARLRRPVVTPVAHLRIHAALAGATAVLVAGHILALVLDRYAGVGLAGAFLPGQSGYRPLPVALGTLGLYVGVLVGSTAALAGHLVGRAWLPIHRVAVVSFALVWAHGVLAGSDTATLRWLYAATGCVVAGLVLTRPLVAPAHVEEGR